MVSEFVLVRLMGVGPKHLEGIKLLKAGIWTVAPSKSARSTAEMVACYTAALRK